MGHHTSFSQVDRAHRPAYWVHAHHSGSCFQNTDCTFHNPKLAMSTTPQGLCPHPRPSKYIPERSGVAIVITKTGHSTNLIPLSTPLLRLPDAAVIHNGHYGFEAIQGENTPSGKMEDTGEKDGVSVVDRPPTSTNSSPRESGLSFTAPAPSSASCPQTPRTSSKNAKNADCGGNPPAVAGKCSPDLTVTNVPVLTEPTQQHTELQPSHVSSASFR